MSPVTEAPPLPAGDTTGDMTGEITGTVGDTEVEASVVGLILASPAPPPSSTLRAPPLPTDMPFTSERDGGLTRALFRPPGQNSTVYYCHGLFPQDKPKGDSQ